MRRASQALGLGTDIADERPSNAMAQATLERFGAIDVLINNASLMSVLPRRSWLEIPVEEWDRVMAVNLRGMFLCCRAVFPAMKAQKRGKIVNISSSRFFEGSPNRLHYTTSKAGVIGFTRALAREVGEFGITVNAVAPGMTASDTQVARPPATISRRASRPRHRAGAGAGGPRRRGDVPVVGRERLHDRPDACWSMAASRCIEKNSASNINSVSSPRKRGPIAPRAPSSRWVPAFAGTAPVIGATATHGHPGHHRRRRTDGPHARGRSRPARRALHAHRAEGSAAFLPKMERCNARTHGNLPAHGDRRKGARRRAAARLCRWTCSSSCRLVEPPLLHKSIRRSSRPRRRSPPPMTARCRSSPIN